MDKKKVKQLDRLFWFGMSLWLIVTSMCAWMWLHLPGDAIVPIHYAYDLTPDKFVHKNVFYFAYPLFMLFFVLLLVWLPRFEPRKRNMEQSLKAYTRIAASFYIFLFAMMLFMTQETLSKHALNASFLAVSLGLIVLVIGNYMSKIQSNYIFGIRTPWTLSSELSWLKTNRLGGKLFVLCGLEMFVGGWLFNHVIVLLLGIAGLLLSSAYLLIYSWMVWKQDSNRSEN